MVAYSCLASDVVNAWSPNQVSTRTSKTTTDPLDRLDVSLPRELAKACATVATCAALWTGGFVTAPSTALAVPVTSQATETTATPAKNAISPAAIDIRVNVPYIVDLVKTPESRTKSLDWASYIVESLQNFVGPAVSITPPTDQQAFARAAMSGGAQLVINGQVTTVQVIGSTPGALQLQITNPLLPAIPFAGLPTTPTIVKQYEYAVADMAPALVQAALPDSSNQLSLAAWDRPIGNWKINLGSWQKSTVTPLDLVEAGSLAVIAAYGVSYGYYVYVNDQEAKEAEKKKAAMAAKKKAKQPGKTKKALTSQTTDTKEDVKVTIEMPDDTSVELTPIEPVGNTRQPGAPVDPAEAQQAARKRSVLRRLASKLSLRRKTT